MGDLSALDGFKVDAPDPFPESDLSGKVQPRYSGRILAFDQSLSDTGWAMIERTGAISACGNLKSTSPHKGHEDTLVRSEYLFRQYHSLISTMAPTLIVHELPPVGGRMARPESSLCSSVAIRCAASLKGIPVRMYGAQKAKKRWTGDGNADKRKVADAIKEMDPTLVGRRPMNQAICDAIAVGWLGLEER